MEKYEISEELINAHRNFRGIYEKEVLMVCRKIHKNFDYLGSYEELHIMDEAEKIVKREMWRQYYEKM